MNIDTKIAGKQVYYRLVALWVLVESFLGGVIHGLKIPVSGLVVGSGAILCICLIAYHFPTKGTIIKATIIVAIFKMMLSPQTPPAAYFAVFFQGCLAELLFVNRKFFFVSCVGFGVLTMVESALQRIVVLVVLYGTNFWNAVNEFITRTTGSNTVTNYSYFIAGIYILFHAIAGLIVGWLSARLTIKSALWKIDEALFIDASAATFTSFVQTNPSPKRRWFRLFLFISWVFLIIIFLQSVSGIGIPLLPSHVSLQILFRSALFILTWYFFVGPLTTMLVTKWLEKQKQHRRGEIEQVLLLLPYTKHLVLKSWQLASGNSRWQRIRNSLKLILTNALHTNG